MTLIPGDPIIWRRKRTTPLWRDLNVQATFVRHLKTGALIRVRHESGVETEHPVTDDEIEPVRERGAS